MIFGKLTKLLSRQQGSNVYGPMKTRVLRVDLLSWQKSRVLWLGLFLTESLLDYMQDLLQEQLSISDFENNLNAYHDGYAH